MAIYNKDEIKNNLSIEEVADLVAELHGEPQNKGSYLICKTICHNPIGEGSYKLYYYDNTKLFKCYTGCAQNTFDIFELICKVKNIANEPTYKYISGSRIEQEWKLPDAIDFVAAFFNITPNFEDFSNQQSSLYDWKIFENYIKKSSRNDKKKIVELKVWDNTILKNLPRPKIIPWLKEGISQEVMNQYGICYNPKSEGIVIPHYDINNNLIGIRERTLIQEEEDGGKYKPAIINGIMYNHPLGFNLYNINNSKEHIRDIKKAIIFEGEKATLLYASYFGIDNDISVACCGSNLIDYQVALLINLGVKEIIIGFDRQYKEIGDSEWKVWTKKLHNIHNKYSAYVTISFLFDLEHNLEYKDSPIDKGIDTFLYLFKQRIYI